MNDDVPSPDVAVTVTVPSPTAGPDSPVCGIDDVPAGVPCIQPQLPEETIGREVDCPPSPTASPTGLPTIEPTTAQSTTAPSPTPTTAPTEVAVPAPPTTPPPPAATVRHVALAGDTRRPELAETGATSGTWYLLGFALTLILLGYLLVLMALGRRPARCRCGHPREKHSTGGSICLIGWAFLDEESEPCDCGGYQARRWFPW